MANPNTGEPMQPDRRFLLPPDLEFDDDAEAACGGIPDDDGWIYLNRPAQPLPRRVKPRPTK